METRSEEKVQTFYSDFVKLPQNFLLPKGQIKIEFYKLKKIQFISTVDPANVTT